MADPVGARRGVVDPASKAGYELEFEDSFDGDTLDRTRWLPHHLPQWSSREQSAARYRLGDGVLRLVIEADQPPWCPEFDGQTRVSSLQTGVLAGPVGGQVGQHRFKPEVVVREAQEDARLYTPQYGLFELRAKAVDDPRCMVALWMIGYEDQPDRSAEICICEIFGRDVTAGRAGVGMGLHPFGDPRIRDEFSVEQLPVDARDFHVYAAEWTPEHVAFFVDNQLVKTVEQSPAYPMQFMLGIYEFPEDGEPGQPSHPYPKEFVVDWFRGYRRTSHDWPFDQSAEGTLRPWYITATGYLVVLFADPEEARRAQRELLEGGVPRDELRLYESEELLRNISRLRQERSVVARAVAALVADPEAKRRFLDNARTGGAALWLVAPTRKRADQLVGLLADYDYSSLRYYGDDGVADLEQGAD
jgi:glycosyl hydrolase family 16